MQVGQRVFICKRKPGKFGTYAEYTVTDKDDIFPLDDRLTFDQGAALGIPYFTAHRALVLKWDFKLIVYGYLWLWPFYE